MKFLIDTANIEQIKAAGGSVSITGNDLNKPVNISAANAALLKALKQP